MTTKVIERFRQWPSADAQRDAVYLVISGIQQGRALRGTDPQQPINVEDLFATADMLANRHSLPIAPFVTQWHERLERLDRSAFKPDSHLKEIEDALEALGRHSTSGRDSPWQSAHRIRSALEALFAADARERPNTMQMVASRMRSILPTLSWITNVSSVAYLTPLVDMARERDVVITTLNYDNAIELAAKEHGIAVHSRLQSWLDGQTPQRPKSGIELLQLHGAIDWEITLFPSSGDPYMKRLSADRVLREQRDPAVVFGSGNKLTPNGPFLDLLWTFGQRLEQHDQLVIVGYSFGDEHVNELMRRWHARSQSRSIVVIDIADTRRLVHDAGFLDRTTHSDLGAEKAFAQQIWNERVDDADLR